MQTTDLSLLSNPHAELNLVREADVICAITVRAPVKGQSLRVTRIEREKEPDVFGTLLMSVIRKDAFRPASEPAAVRKRLGEIGLLLPENQISNPVWFTCDVDDQLLDLVPRRARPDLTRPAKDLVINPTLRHFGTSGPPPEMRGRKRLPSRFHPDRSWIWLEDPVLSMPCVYSGGHEADGYFDRLIPCQPPPANLTGDARQCLSNAGVLGSAAEPATERGRRARQVADARRQLDDVRYTVLPHIVRPLQLAALRRYYRKLIAEGFLRYGDDEWNNRYFTDRDSIAHFFHQQLTGLVSELAGERVRPTFSFFASYRPGSELPPHRDREQCEYSMSVLIDHSPEPEDVSPWPIFLQPPEVDTAFPINLGIGDALLYRGAEVSHYRDPLPQGQYSSLWFFFYVGESFAGILD
jgi:hypothetical protein